MIEPAALRTVSVFGLDVSTLCFQFVCDSIEPGTAVDSNVVIEPELDPVSVKSGGVEKRT